MIEPVATLPLVLFVVLFELAVGGAVVMWVLDRMEETPLGYLRLNGIVNVAAAAFGALIVGALPPAAEMPQWAPFTVALLVALTFAATFFPGKALRQLMGAAAIVAGLALLVYATRARPGDPFDVLAVLALPLGAMALGGANAAMLLGHWYLVTPKLSPTPLQRAALIFFFAVVFQGVLAALSFARGEGTAAWELSPIAVAIRVGVGILAPAIIALAAWWTARMNTQSSTGLLYVGLAMVLAGELSARMVFFIAGVPI